MKHARKSLSASPRWYRCPGSIWREEKYIDVSSPAAIDGTGSHLLLEKLLKHHLRNEPWVEEDFVCQNIGLGNEDKPDGWLVDKERYARVMVAVEYVKKRMKEMGEGTFLLVESKTNPGLKYGIEDMWGTVDITLLNSSEIEVIDYKDGFTYVDESTEQLVGYAAGQIDYSLIERFSVSKVKKTIIQPKIERDPIRSLSHTVEQNTILMDKLSEAARLAENPNAPLLSGDHCKWCKHRTNCEERNNVAFNMLEGLHPSKMLNKQLSSSLDNISTIEDFIENLKEEAKNRISDGEKLSGWGIETKFKTRVWIDENDAELKIKNFAIKGVKLTAADRFKKKLITPTALLKLDLSKNQIKTVEKLFHRKVDGMKLVKTYKSELDVEEMFPPVVTNEEQVTPLVTNEERMLVMTNEAGIHGYFDFKRAGWTDEDLIDEGYAMEEERIK